MTSSIRTTTTEHHMPAFTTTPRPSAVQGLRSYGLASIELQRVSDRRSSEATPPGIIGRSPGLLHRMRQMSGELMIRIGTGVAGDTAGAVMSPATRPGIDMA